jgi:hypothetical protein
MRAHHVGGEGVLDHRVERDVTGAVDDDVEAGGQLGQRIEVALEHLNPGEQRVGATRLRLRGREGRLGEQASDPLGAGLPGLGPHEQHRNRLGQVGQHPLQQRLTDESGDAGQQDAAAAQPFAQPHLTPSGPCWGLASSVRSPTDPDDPTIPPSDSVPSGQHRAVKDPSSPVHRPVRPPTGAARS